MKEDSPQENHSSEEEAPSKDEPFSEMIGLVSSGAPAGELATEALQARMKEEDSPLLALYDLGALSKQLAGRQVPGGEARAEKAREAARILARRFSSELKISPPEGESSTPEDATPKDGSPKPRLASESGAEELKRETPAPEKSAAGEPAPGESAPEAARAGAPQFGKPASNDNPFEEESSPEQSGHFYAEIKKGGYHGATAVEADGPGEAYHQVAGYFVKESGGAVSPEDVEAHVRLFRFTGESLEEKRTEIRQEVGSSSRDSLNQDSDGRDSEWDPATDPDFRQIDASAAANQMLSRSGP